jgi:hypothetical protein
MQDKSLHNAQRTASRVPLHRPVLYRVAPFATYVAFMVLADVLGRFEPTARTPQSLYPVKIAAVVALLWLFRRSYDELRWRLMPDGREQLIAVGAGVLVFGAWISLDAGWMIAGAPHGYMPLNGTGLDWTAVAIRLTGAAIVVPLMEELFWRSFLLRRLVHVDFLRVKPGAVRYFAFVVTAGLFAVEHNEWFAGLLAGAAFNLLYIRSGTLWSPVIAHAVANALLGTWVLTTDNWKYW